MTSLERPKNWRDLAAGFVLNNLNDEERMLWKTLCEQEPDLEQEARQMQQTFNQFADVIPLHMPSQSLLETIRLKAHPPGRPTGDPRGSSVARIRQGEQGFPRGSTYRFSGLQKLAMMVGLGAIAFLSAQVYGLHTQVQQLNQQLNAQQQQLQHANTQMADIQSQLDQSTSQLSTLEESLAQSKDREESMHQILQQLTQESSAPLGR